MAKNKIVEKKQSRRSSLTVAKNKQKVASYRNRIRSMKKLQIPALTTAAVAIPTALAVEDGMKYGTLMGKIRGTANYMMMRFTGFVVSDADKQIKFVPKKAVGVPMLAAVMLANKLKIFRSANVALARTKLPLRLK